MSDCLKKAQKAFDEGQKAVNPEYKPRYHLSVPSGWLNDPNGIGYFKGKYHLFYQYYPYDSVWGLMHWGHWTSEDLLTWKQEPVAMAPDCEYDAAGCFSGSALDVDGRYCIMYTGVIDEPSTGRTPQHQCLAWTDDGIHVEKAAENPVIPLSLAPEGICPYDFRDPKLEKTDNGYRLVVAARVNDGGKILTYSSPDLKRWTYDGVYAEGFSEMAECPDFFELDGKRVLVSSIMGCKDESLVLPQPVVYMIGHEDNGRFAAETPMRDIDRGLDFYAPQTFLAPDGRRIMISWAHAWGCTTPMHKLGHGWTGTMTLMRECRLENGSLYQQPIRELMSLRRNGVAQHGLEIAEKALLPQCSGPCREILMDVDLRGAEAFTLNLMETESEHVEISYDKQKNELAIDRSASGYSLVNDGQKLSKMRATASAALRDGILSLRIFVDVSIIEVYVNQGEKVLTCQAFPKGKAYGASASAKGTAVITQLESYEIG